MDTSSRRFTVNSASGMCNRLRTLLSAKAIAEATAREFAMRWQPNVACGADFAQLFENDWRLRADVAFDAARAFDLTVTAWHDYPDWLALETPHVFVLHWGWLIQPDRFAAHRALETRTKTLMNELAPVPDVLRRVRAFQNNFFRANMIGVHLRRGDMTQLRPDTTTNLAAAVQQIDARLDVTNDAGILLCTDDGARNPYTGQPTPHENVRAQFLQRYGKRVVFTESALTNRAAPEAIQEALTDLWLLRATDSFVGTLGSSFSELAVYGRDIPFAQTAGGSPHYQQRARLIERFGIAALLARWAHHEYGKAVPYTCLRGRYLRRARMRFKKFIPISMFRRNI